MVRSLTASDHLAARALVHATYAGSRHLTRTLELLGLAVGGNDPECVGMVCTLDGGVDAIVMHGTVAGADGVQKLHALAGRASSLVLLVDALQRQGHWRMLVCELAASGECAVAGGALLAGGYTREGSVAAFYDDHTALDIWVLRRTAAG